MSIMLRNNPLLVRSKSVTEKIREFGWGMQKIGMGECDNIDQYDLIMLRQSYVVDVLLHYNDLADFYSDE